MNFRYAIRALARTPGFTLVAILTLALGIGAATAMLAVINSVLFKPLSFHDPDRLYVVRTLVSLKQEPATTRHFPINAHHFSDWRERCDLCDDVALVGGTGFTLTGAGSPERLPGLNISYNLFHTLGVQPAIGRDFTSADEGPGKPPVVLLTDALWRRVFNSDPAVVGRTILLNGTATTVVGIMPASLRLPRGEEWGPFFAHSETSLLFQPFARDFNTVRPAGNFNYVALVRTHAGVSPRAAESEMTSIIEPYSRETPATASAELTPLAAQMTGGSARHLWLLLAAVMAVLVLVSLNVGGLLLTRGVSRSRETSIRLALGADTRDLLALVLVEAATLVAGGAVAGVALATTALRAFVAAAPIDLPRLDEIRPDWHLFAFALAAMAAATALASIAPTWRLLSGDLGESLVSATKNATDTTTRIRVLDFVMAIEIALSTAVLLAGTLLAISFINVMRADRGFVAEHVVTQALSLATPRFAEPAVRTRFVGDTLEALRRLPGVTAVGETSQLPLQGESWIDSLIDPDRGDTERDAPLTNHRFVSPGFVGAMGIQLRAGRDFDESDRTRFVALISERAARLLWPNENAIGKHVRGPGGGGRPGEPPPTEEVIGVVADVRAAGLEKEPPPTVYTPYWRLPGGAGGPLFALRTMRDAASLAGEIRAIVASFDPELPVQSPQAMSDAVWGAASLRLFQTSIVTLFTATALVIAAIGLYGLVSFSVVRRTREIGIRMALGATAGAVARTVFRQGLRPVGIGAALGLAFVLVAGDVLASELYGVTPRDPLAIAIVAATLAMVSALACWIPMRRATRVDPVMALRAE